jgi:hypothetical protein
MCSGSLALEPGVSTRNSVRARKASTSAAPIPQRPSAPPLVSERLGQVWRRRFVWGALPLDPVRKLSGLKRREGQEQVGQVAFT